jgi:cytochrome P450 family 3 subfamily A
LIITIFKILAFFRPDRTCTKDWSLESKGITVNKGTHIVFPLYAIHHDEEVWPEPGKFKPERWIGDNKKDVASCSFMTFGHGQRQCLGTRLAVHLFKIFIASLLKEFKLERRSDTIWKEAKGSTLLVKLDPIYLDFVKK